jgi:nucleotide-binding universal stress UspA family protein
VWKVLAPVDLSVDAEASVGHAIDVANVFSAELVLLNVLEKGWLCDPRRAGWPRNARQIHTPGPDIHRLTLPGRAPEIITQYADFIKADLLLLPSRMYGSWKRLWRRSVARQVMAQSARPVCVTRSARIDSRYRFLSRRILCLVGLDGQDTPIIELAEDLAGRSGAEVILLHVGREQQSREFLADDLRQLATTVSSVVTTSLMIGSPAQCVGMAAREHAADMVIAPRARPGAHGPYTADLEAALANLHCPLLTVPLGERKWQRGELRDQPFRSAKASSISFFASGDAVVSGSRGGPP